MHGKAHQTAEGRHDPDLPLIRAVADGDMSAAAELVARHADRIHAICWRLLGDASQAEDLTQEVFLKVWKHAARWEPGRALFSTWLHRVTINLCHDRLRKRREIALDVFPEAVRENLAGQVDGIARLEARDEARHVRAAIEDLPERQRMALVLCHYEGFTNIEAAEALDCSVEAVESLLARARRNLKTALSGLAEERAGKEVRMNP